MSRGARIGDQPRDAVFLPMPLRLRGGAGQQAGEAVPPVLPVLVSRLGKNGLSSTVLCRTASAVKLEMLFPIGFIRFFVSPCFCSVGALLHTGPRMLRSWEKLVFYWFYKDFLADPRVPGWGEQQPS